jgi:hypothetical protein
MNNDPFQSSKPYPLDSKLFNLSGDLSHPQILRSVYKAIEAAIVVVNVLANGDFRYILHRECQRETV